MGQIQCHTTLLASSSLGADPWSLDTKVTKRTWDQWDLDTGLKPWSTGKQLPLGFNPTDRSHLGLSIQLVLCRVLIGGVQSLRAASCKPQASSGKLQAVDKKGLKDYIGYYENK